MAYHTLFKGGKRVSKHVAEVVKFYHRSIYIIALKKIIKNDQSY